VTYQVDVHPDIWAKLTAIGTVGSAIVALLLAGWAAIAQSRLRRQLDDREARAQARRVVAIPTTEYRTIDGTTGGFTADFVDIVNAGDEPIFEARMIYGGSDKGYESMRDWEWWAGNGNGTMYTPLVQASDQYRFPGNWHAVESPDASDPCQADRGGFYGVIAWSDARDRHWIRRGRDQPVELRRPMVYGADPQPVHRRDASTRTIREARSRIIPGLIAAMDGNGPEPDSPVSRIKAG
jgi:hypothetical protein